MTGLIFRFLMVFVVSFSAVAQIYPSKPIKIVVSFDLPRVVS